MAEIQTKFRASFGLDAAGEKVVNVALADRTVPTDSANVAYITQENTIQKYDPNRAAMVVGGATVSYPEGFVVTYDNRAFMAKQNVPYPAGPFNDGYWQPLRVDPKWVPVNSGKRQLQTGDFISIDTAAGLPVEFTLPSNAADGDSIFLKDVGGRTGFTDVIVKAGLQSIYDRGQLLMETKMTIPYSEWMFVFVNKLWNLYNSSEAELSRFVKSGAVSDLQAGEHVIRQYTSQTPITLKLPKNANDGDMIHFVGTETNSPYYTMVINTYDTNTSIISPGLKTTTIRRDLTGYLVYEDATSTWKLYDTDITSRLKRVNSNTQLYPNDLVAVVGTSNTVAQTIDLTLPSSIEVGDTVTIDLNYMRLLQTVNIKAPAGTTIYTNMTMAQFPRRSEYPPATAAWTSVQQLTYVGSTSYVPTIKLAYMEEGSLKYWMIVDNVPTVERVDATSNANRARLGVIALATQAQANIDLENNPEKELAITPETLANRTSLETRRGIARIATQAEVNLLTDAAALADDIIVTPKKLNGKKATETMVGLAEIATQAEANGSTDDARIITAKKLDARRATPTMAGIAPVVTSGGVAGTGRDIAGTLIYNSADYSNIVTPKTLKEYIATTNASGTVYIATNAEVIAGTAASDAAHPIVVTPADLHSKTATDARIGFSEVATQTEVNAGTDYFRYVTPKTLNDRIASETLTGIAAYATQAEFDAGTAAHISEPSKIKNFFDRTARTSVTAADGLTQSGTIWTTVNFGIVAPTTTQRGTTRLSTQAEVNAGTDNTTIVTPLTLHTKKATTVAEGIIRVANTAETVAGTSANTAVCPLNLKHIVQTETTWEATTTRRGFVTMTEEALTFVGNDTVGSTVPLTDYKQTGYAVSPYELNKTLANFMPRKAKAVDSDLLDGLDSTQFVRRDINQTVNGSITFTSPIVANDTVRIKGFLTIGGDVDATKLDQDIGKVYIQNTTRSSGWVFATNDSASIATIKFGYKYTPENAVPIDIQAFEISQSGAISFNNTMNVIGASTFRSTLNVSGVVSTDSVGYRISGLDAITAVSGATRVGNLSRSLDLIGSDAGNIRALDSGTAYLVLTTKNRASILDPLYIKKSGDTMGGRLNVPAPMTNTIVQTSAAINAPTATNFGCWSANITDPAIYNTLPKYLVPIPEINSETGQPTGFIDHYEEYSGPGILTQVGTNSAAIDGTYQMWAVRPPVSTDGHNAQTYYMRTWNNVKGNWDGWGRMYTSNLPPTAKDIGAISDNGSVLSTLKVRNWMQIGNLRMYADPTTKTVRFDWIE